MGKNKILLTFWRQLVLLFFIFVSDSYVAVTGLPDPQPDHAIIMAKFAMECRAKMREVTKKLVRTLGPETEDLQMRFGLNSGPVVRRIE